MEGIAYLGEHLWPGQLGHWSVISSFLFAIVAALGYYKFEKQGIDQPGWKLLGRWAFAVHSAFTLLVIFLLFFIMLKRYYEYQYVWAHVSDDLPFHYMFSAFWEDQAGSFLLWAFWHLILGMILMRKAGEWEAPVMMVLSLIQAIIISMLLGFYIGDGDFHIGVTPFALLRDTMDAPIFSNASYLTLITGKGLNPLLQNYWMVIHPPTLFLGFASTAIPFCYAIGGMWRGDTKGWLKPVLPWALFSGAILGLGILMGGAWAYEALSFGGYWAWDPVENMSLVPWLILIAGIHTNLVAKSTGHAVRSTLVFYGLTFILVLYSTFLTRSGVLQDSSVHSFTEMGLSWQLTGFILFFLGLFTFVYIRYFRKATLRTDEEPLLSREFWMFVGSLVLLFSAVLITFTTSIPVFNKITDGIGWLVGKDLSQWHRSMPLDPIEHYNKYQFWIAVLIGLLAGFTQYLRYNQELASERKSQIIRQTVIHIAGAALFTFLTWQWLRIPNILFHILVFCAWYAVIANAFYFVQYFRMNIRMGSSTIAHMGFGLMLVGIVASGMRKQHISQNRFAMHGIIGEDIIDKNVLLFKNAPLNINGYIVNYVGDTLIGFHRYYHVDFVKVDSAGATTDSFRLSPNVQFDREFKKQAASNPSTKRYFNRDIFTHIAGIPPELGDLERAKAKEDSLRYLMYKLLAGETVRTEKVNMQLLSWETGGNHIDYEPQPGDLVVSALIRLKDEAGNEDTLSPMIVMRERLVYNFPAKSDLLEVKIRLSDRIFNAYLAEKDPAAFQTIILKEGEKQNISGIEIFHSGFIPNAEHPQYTEEEGDIRIGARLLASTSDTMPPDTLIPVYLIRGNAPYNLPSIDPLHGLQVQFVKIDPNDGNATFMVFHDPALAGIELEVADNYTREDYIVLEAIIFPGINLFWLGSTMMMIGLFLGMWNKRRQS